MSGIPLRFESEEAAISSLLESGWIQNDKGQLYRKGHHLVMLGTLHKPTGKMLVDEEGFEYPETAPIPGYHVDILCPDTEAGCYTPIDVKTRLHTFS